jgi:nicotinate-nucleotide adenylyltransferase
VLAASYALSVGFDRVLVAVVKSHAFPKRLSTFEHRVAMARLAFAPLAAVEVSEVEASLPQPSYTLNTLQHIHQLHPDWQMRLLVGADVLPEFDKWYRFDEVAALAPPFLLGRGGYAAQTAVCLPEVSSSEARRKLAETPTLSDTSAWLAAHLPERVLDYVRREGLYSAERAATRSNSNENPSS